MKFSFVGLRYVWFALSAVMILGSIASLLVFGLNLSIDFTGGSLMEVTFPDAAPENDAVATTVESAGFRRPSVQASGDHRMILRLEPLLEDQHQTIKTALTTAYPGISEERFDSIGPAISGELEQKALTGVGITLLLIGAYIAWVFRNVSRPVASWKYGLLTMFTAFHDVIVPVGVFAFLGHFYGWEVGTAFVAAVLTILGYSISDTVVVFDRTRENLIAHAGTSFEEIVEKSIRQTFVRSVNTSVTALLALAAIFLWGGDSTRPFALALIIGIAVGTYSSIFVASPALVEWEHWKKR